MTAILDETIYAECLELMGDELPAVLNMYIGLVEQGMQKMQQALAAGDLMAISHAAHSLKSSSKQLGFLKFSELMKQLEEHSKTSGAPITQVLLEQAQEMAVEIMQTVRAKLG